MAYTYSSWIPVGTEHQTSVMATRSPDGPCVFMHLLLGTSAGTYAEFICVDEEELARMPDRMSFQDAAALPLVTLTAWQVAW